MATAPIHVYGKAFTSSLESENQMILKLGMNVGDSSSTKFNGTVSDELLGGGLKHVLLRKPRPPFLKWHKTFSWLFGSHDNPLTRQ